MVPRRRHPGPRHPREPLARRRFRQPEAPRPHRRLNRHPRPGLQHRLRLPGRDPDVVAAYGEVFPGVDLHLDQPAPHPHHVAVAQARRQFGGEGAPREQPPGLGPAQDRFLGRQVDMARPVLKPALGRVGGRTRVAQPAIGREDLAVVGAVQAAIALARRLQRPLKGALQIGVQLGILRIQPQPRAGFRDAQSPVGGGSAFREQFQGGGVGRHRPKLATGCSTGR